MRILLEDGFSVDKGTGVGRYTQSLAAELGKQPDIEILPHLARGVIPKVRPAMARRILYAAWLETGFQRQLRALGPDLVHFTNYLVPRNRDSRTRYAVTIHDLTAWHLPKTLPPLYGMYLRSAISHALEFADLILCPSNAIRNQVIERFGLKGESVRTAWNAEPRLPELSAQMQEKLAAQIHRDLGLKKPFILFVGTLERRKNVSTLVEAFARVAKAVDLQLVMVGRSGYGFSEIEASIKRQACPDRYILTGYVGDEELSLLYSLADLFAYPSHYEGFGIPLVEAMSFGLPIVASRIPASVEVAGDAALFYDNPMDEKALAEKILEALGNPILKAELASRGKQRAVRFCWKKVIHMYVNAYKDSLNGC